MKNKLKWFYALFLLVLTASCFAQKSEEYRPLKLDEAEEIENQRIDGKDVLKARGHVRFSQDTLMATCDQAAFFRDLQTAVLIGRVVLWDQHRRIYCDRARYYAKQRKSVCESNVIFVDGSTTLVADSLVYYLNIEQLFADGHVVTFDSVEAVTLYGDKGFYDVKKKYATVSGHPYMVQYDSSKFKGQNVARMSLGMTSEPIRDSTGNPVKYRPDEQLTARGLFVESYTDSHLVLIRDSVFVTREKLVTTSGRARYNTKKETLLLQDTPVATYESNRMTGDSMAVWFQGKEIHTIDVVGTAVATSDADRSGYRKNRLTAKAITMNVRERKLTTMEAHGNAYNLYYLENQDGANEISGPGMVLFFNDSGKLKNFRVYGGAEGTYYPKKFESLLRKTIQ